MSNQHNHRTIDSSLFANTVPTVDMREGKQELQEIHSLAFTLIMYMSILYVLALGTPSEPEKEKL